MTQYKRRDVYNAYQNDGVWQNFMKWLEACKGGPIQVGDGDFPDISRNPDGSLAIVTSMGLMACRVGDWVFQTSRGECMAIEKGAFEKVFEPVEAAKDAPVLSLIADPPRESPTGEAAIVPDEKPMPRIEWPDESLSNCLMYAFLLAGDNPEHAEEIGMLLLDHMMETSKNPTLSLVKPDLD